LEHDFTPPNPCGNSWQTYPPKRMAGAKFENPIGTALLIFIKSQELYKDAFVLLKQPQQPQNTSLLANFK